MSFEREIVQRITALEREVQRLRTLEQRVPIIARYNTAAGQVLANTNLTVIDFGTKIIDSHNAVATGSGWTFTAPTTGTYLVSASVLFATTTAWANGEVGQLELYKGATRWSVLRRDSGLDTTTATQFKHLAGCDTVTLATGETINIRASQASGAALALHTDATFNYVNVVKVN